MWCRVHVCVCTSAAASSVSGSSICTTCGGGDVLPCYVVWIATDGVVCCICSSSYQRVGSVMVYLLCGCICICICICSYHLHDIMWRWVACHVVLCVIATRCMLCMYDGVECYVLVISISTESMCGDVHICISMAVSQQLHVYAYV